MWSPPFVPLLSVKYLNFGQKLPIWAAHHAFLESRYPEVTKMFCPLKTTKGEIIF